MVTRVLPRLPRVQAQFIREDGPSYDSLVVQFNSAVVAAGGTLSTNTLAATDTFIRAARRDGFLNKLRILNLLCGSNLSGALVQFIGDGAGNFTFANATSVNFVSGDYDELSGLTGNTSNKYLDIGVQSTGATGGYGFYLRATVPSVASRSLMGASDATDNYFVQQNITPNYGGRFGKTTVATVAATIPVGSLHVDRSSSTRLDLYQNGVSVANSTTSTTPAPIAQSWFVFARNASGTPTQFTAGPMSAYWVTDTLSSAEALAFHNALQAFQTALGRAV